MKRGRTQAERAAQSGTLTEMMTSYHDNVLVEQPNNDDGTRLMAMMDYNAGALGALTLIRARLQAGENAKALAERLYAEACLIFERLDPDLYRKKT